MTSLNLSKKLLIFILLGLTWPLMGQWKAERVEKAQWPDAVRSKARSMASLSVVKFDTTHRQSPQGPNQKAQSIMLPLQNEGELSLDLQESYPLAPQFSISLSSGKTYEKSLPSFYSGQVKGAKDSRIALLKTQTGWEGRPIR